MFRLVVFDVEGVILPRKRTLLVEIAQCLRLWKTLLLLIYGFSYQLKIISVRTFLKKSYKLFREQHIDIFYDIYYRTPKLRNSKDVFVKLNELGVTTALISSGLPQEIVDELKKELCANYAYGVQVEKDQNGTLSGEIEGDVIENEGKKKILNRIVVEMGISYNDVAIVADDSNNLQMLECCSLFIGFNPENMVASKTSEIVTGNDLQQVYEILQGKPNRKNIHMKEIFLRKLIHSTGVLTLLFLKLYGLYYTQVLIVSIMALYILSEYLRLKGGSLPFFTWLTRLIALGLEETNIVTTPIWYALGFLITYTLFPFPYAAIGILTLTLGDATASIVGQTLNNKHLYPFNKSKSLEGTITGIFVATLCCSFFFDPYVSLIGCSVGMIIETLPTPFNDNITIPFLSSLVSLLFGKYWKIYTLSLLLYVKQLLWA